MEERRITNEPAMPTYKLYLESGPRKYKTMVHVLDLLGCVAAGPTTEAAAVATPEAIRAFLRFLQRHGEDVDPDQGIETQVAEHITEGQFLGNGSPTAVYVPDLKPLKPKELERLVTRLEWLQSDLLELLRGLSARQLDAKTTHGRAIRDILLHIVGAERGYMGTAFGKIEGLAAAARGIDRPGADLLAQIPRVRAVEFARLRAATLEERERVVRRGEYTRTLRRAIRRMLEHGWEHYREIEARLGTGG